MHSTALAFFGGDIASGDGPAVFSVTAIAIPANGENAVTRTGARAGDYLCVTGELVAVPRDV